MKTSISPQDVLSRLVIGAHSVKAVDVRSSGEFFNGSITGFKNIPILTDQERHEVGLCFKISGQSAAIELGYKLVGPYREERTKNWIQYLEGAELPIVTCWRGGLRSEIALQWIREQKLNLFRVEGGYKALRGELIKVFNEPPQFLVVAGPTGSGKTALIKEVNTPKIDLENLAAHRGSAFGKLINKNQPRQATFENSLALEFLRQPQSPILIEDESLAIGQVQLPLTVKAKISGADVVKINLPIKDRLIFLYEEYIQEPLGSGVSNDSLGLFYEEALFKIKDKLGGLLTTTILANIRLAFQLNEREIHHQWIQCLLENYYDKMYEYSFSKYQRKILFEGDWHECKSWIQKRFA